MTTVSKAELSKRISDHTEIPRVTVQTVLETAMAQITAAAMAGEKVTLQGFGRFEMKERAARTGRNPRTGEAVDIPASQRLSFKPAKSKP